MLDLLSIGVERRRILNYVWNTSGRKLFAGDLSNIAKEVKDKLREVPEKRAEQLLEELRGELFFLYTKVFERNANFINILKTNDLRLCLQSSRDGDKAEW